LEGPASSADEALAVVKACMEHPLERPLEVALVVDAHIVDNWHQAK
jgi:DNA polymerase I-like protein with 3'-5' exonuclease and polymerase domains